MFFTISKSSTAYHIGSSFWAAATTDEAIALVEPLALPWRAEGVMSWGHELAIDWPEPRPDAPQWVVGMMPQG